MSRASKTALIVGLSVLAATVLGAVITGVVLIPHGDRIHRGVSVAGFYVGSISRAQATPPVAKALDARLQKKIALRWRDRQWEYTAGELGAEFDVEGAMSRAMQVGRQGNIVERFMQSVRAAAHPVNIEPQLRLAEDSGRTAVMRLSTTLSKEAKDARLKVQDGGLTLEPDEPGAVLDVEKALRAIERALQKGQTAIDLPVEEIPAEITAQDLQGIDGILGDFTTKFNAGAASRSHNIALATNLLNGVVIRPGETFSFNQVVGDRTAKRGFQTAPIYQNGRVVPGTGGGVCQVSTTLYNAALLAGLAIVERTHHSMPVPYVPIARDATVAYGSVDLKLRNPYQHPVYLVSAVDGDRVRFTIAGFSGDKPEVEITSARTATIPVPEKTVVDPSLPPGKKVVEQAGKSGAKGWAKRTIRRPGQEPVVEDLSSDYYMPQPRIIRVGQSAGMKPPTAPPTEEIPPAPSPTPPPEDNEPPAGPAG